jgi:hypothetical protein
MKKTYHGSCHCGAIAFEADIDLSEGIRKCNCSFCWKVGYRKAFTSFDGLRIVKGKQELYDYQAKPSAWPPGNINHYCCRNCCTQPFSRGHLEQMGGNFWAVNIGCLDDATEQELADAPVIYEDGKRDQQMSTPEITGYL